MSRRRRALPPSALPSLLAAALAAAGCGADEPSFDPACTTSAGAIEQALRKAPAPVTLTSGTRLSDCVSRARTDADLQNTGTVLTRAADDLADRAKTGDAGAALALGYLVGAARRGAAQTQGIQAELRRRMEASARFVGDGGPRVTAALDRGLRAGEATG